MTKPRFLHNRSEIKMHETITEDGIVAPYKTFVKTRYYDFEIDNIINHMVKTNDVLFKDYRDYDFILDMWEFWKHTNNEQHIDFLNKMKTTKVFPKSNATYQSIIERLILVLGDVDFNRQELELILGNIIELSKHYSKKYIKDLIERFVWCSKREPDILVNALDYYKSLGGDVYSFNDKISHIYDTQF